MKLHIGSGHLQGDIDPLHLYDEASVELLRLGRVSKARRQGRARDHRRDDEIHFGRRSAGRREGLDARGQRHGR